MEVGEGDEQVLFPLPLTNLSAPATTIKKDDSEEDRDVQMAGTECFPSPKVDSLVDEGIEEDAKDVLKAETETSAHPSEQEIVDAFNRSDEEDEGI